MSYNSKLKSVNYFENAFNNILSEDVDLTATSPKTIRIKNQETGKVEVVDLSNFIFSNTNGGTENFTIVGIRANDSKTDPSKKAGDEMTINGRLKYKYSGTGEKPLGDAKQRYDKYDTLTVLVTSVDGEPYPKESIRSFKVNTIKKIIMSGETYNILR
jgi:hypothetical protein